MKLYFAACVLFIGACSSGPVPIEYYLLSSPASQQSSVAVPCKVPYSMVIESVELASFLRQSGLVYQTAANKLTVSKTHLWAENLDQSLPKALVGYLRQLAGDCHFYLKGHDWYSDEDYRVRLRVDHMQATTGGEVISSGHFQVIDSRGRSPAVTREFSFSRELEENGYAHAVVKMDLLVREIAESILQAASTYSSSQEEI